jgi:multidrug efflux pump subunit AcrA (membrane-fusion protein)
MTFQIPKAEKEAPRPKVQWWIIVLVLVGAIFAWKTFGERPASQVVPAAPVKVVPLK